MQIKHRLILIPVLMIGLLGELALANCYFIRLNGYHFDHGFDVFSWGEISPLIALDAGDYYNLSPSGQDRIDIAHGESKNLEGELYYIPKSLINNKQFSLKMMVVERDTDTPDDLVLPMSERSISFSKEAFLMDSMRTDISFHPFADPVTQTAKNKQRYRFEIIRDDGNCNTDTVEGKANDQRFRLQNRLKQLYLHVKLYEKAFLSGGQEYGSYHIPTIKENSFSDAVNIAESIATVNSNELIKLGMSLEKLDKVENFKSVWREYIYLVRRLLRQHITIQYLEEKKYKEVKVPSLRFHPDWKKFNDHKAVMPPERWNISTLFNSKKEKHDENKN